ncbi:hypothetical protein G6L63_22020 [Agrobacterium vitis]|uniref:Uncharacterized protein n=1 Tax=Agrobacterium vitis TaxID=373 RepID=A0A368NSB3_AGRVI|nr:hypothetical protein [Agrobacterium vitis]KAA3517412.1 hypothetical protein DXM22_06665 [Agrobacterium vitis]KAA3526812.1 hypothetical protein DXT89_12655 [Agrobacterium vitis]MCF1477182.1 hypothetical protein [Agrobacterium vitis]MUZ99483.1 hypothetical protein [Agrobacterium vitis]MVA32309.1 hypothetical protein [Agrobacterium vitis]
MRKYQNNRHAGGDGNNSAGLDMAIARDSTPTRTGKKRFRKENIRQAKPQAKRTLLCHFASTEAFSNLETTALLTALHDELRSIFPSLKGDG